jgi:hypothetical protein
MSQSRSKSSWDSLQNIVLGHQLNYSFSQLRLLGMLLLLCLALRLLALVWLGTQDDPLTHLHLIEQASQSLPLLPVAMALVLLGGGRQRQQRELLFIDSVRRALVPLALVCLLVFPSLTFVAQETARNELKQRSQSLAELRTRFERFEADLDGVQDSTTLMRIARSAGLAPQLNPNLPVQRSLQQLKRQMERDLRAAEQRELGATTPIAVQSLLPALLATSLFEQFITGFALLWMDRQGRRIIRRHGLTMGQFFHSDVIKGRNAG